AAIGITEESDAIAIVVSEETNRISIAHNGRLTENLDAERLRRALRSLLRVGETTNDQPPERPSAARGILDRVRGWFTRSSREQGSNRDVSSSSGRRALPDKSNHHDGVATPCRRHWKRSALPAVADPRLCSVGMGDKRKEP